VHSEAVYLGGLLASGPPQAFGGAGLCTDDPRLAVPEDHRALEKLISHGFGWSPSTAYQDVQLVALSTRRVSDNVNSWSAADAKRHAPTSYYVIGGPVDLASPSGRQVTGRTVWSYGQTKTMQQMIPDDLEKVVWGAASD
jgi:hypothetical protein